MYLNFSRLFSDNTRLREHLAKTHLPRAANSAGQSKKQQQEEQRLVRQHQQIQKQQLEAFQRLKDNQEKVANIHMVEGQDTKMIVENKTATPSAAAPPVGGEDAATASTDAENAINREIAGLLLNLQASRTTAPPSSDVAAFGAASSTLATTGHNKPEDLSIKSIASKASPLPETAMDLTKSSKSDYSAPLPASISKLVKSAVASAETTLDLSKGTPVATASGGVTLIPASAAVPTTTASADYNALYPSLASIASSMAGGGSPNYLLQNLLLGKNLHLMQQIAASTSVTPATTVSPPAATPATSAPVKTTTINLSSSLPTQPIPAQSLTLEAATAAAAGLPKANLPPASVLKAVNASSRYRL